MSVLIVGTDVRLHMGAEAHHTLDKRGRADVAQGAGGARDGVVEIFAVIGLGGY